MIVIRRMLLYAGLLTLPTGVALASTGNTIPIPEPLMSLPVVHACMPVDSETFQINAEGLRVAAVLKAFIGVDVLGATEMSVRVWQGQLQQSNSFEHDTHSEPTEDDRLFVQSILGEDFARALTTIERYRQSWEEDCPGIEVAVHLVGHKQVHMCVGHAPCNYSCSSAGCKLD